MSAMRGQSACQGKNTRSMLPGPVPGPGRSRVDNPVQSEHARGKQTCIVERCRQGLVLRFTVSCTDEHFHMSTCIGDDGA